MPWLATAAAKLDYNLLNNVETVNQNQPAPFGM